MSDLAEVEAEARGVLERVEKLAASEGRVPVELELLTLARCVVALCERVRYITGGKYP